MALADFKNPKDWMKGEDFWIKDEVGECGSSRPDLLPTLHGFLDGRVWIGREVNIQIYIHIQRFCKRVYEKEFLGRFLKGLYVYVYLYI